MRHLLYTLVALALLAGGAAAQPDPPYESPMREQCEAELAKDLRWRARLNAEFTDDNAFAFHDQQATLFAKHEKHVIAAYTAIWIITVGFVVALYLRQRKLQEDIGRLEAEIARAARAAEGP